MKNKHKYIYLWNWLFCVVFIISLASCAYQTKDQGELKELKNQKDSNILKNNISYKDTITHDNIKSLNHKIHTEAGATCKTCHLKAYTSSEAGMPNERLCGFCHETVYEGQPINEVYNREDWFLSQKRARAKYTKINMSHLQHINKGIKCADCHGNIANSINISEKHIPVKKTCLSCHGEWNTKGKCMTCHKELIPPSHSGSWVTPKHNHCLQCHIPISSAAKCKDCHDTASCVSSIAPSRPWDLPHRRGLMCRPCHSAENQSLIHVDNAIECRTCHKLPVFK